MAADGVLRRGGRLLKDQLHSFLAEMQIAFVEGRFQEIAANFVFPLVVYTPVGVTLIRNPDQFAQVSSLYRDAIIALDVASSDIRIEECDQPRNRRFRVTARFTDFNAEGTHVTGSLIRYFMIEDSDSFKVEMMEYLELPIPISDVERIVH